ncbi:tail fiber [Chlorella sorokiniana]|uniref:Tail fiber n=1 Tax=Chlorella sorokiniana TaxID=3076 RepID=A0A2P6U309_CHLSO|nr:tail fiber [Chlorella sorokiniana]|eukprot:PRW60691.1 tail fiber [Chlorella sorokiniana]
MESEDGSGAGGDSAGGGNGGSSSRTGGGSGSGSGTTEQHLDPPTPEQPRSLGAAQTPAADARAQRLQQGWRQRTAEAAASSEQPVLWLDGSSAAWTQLSGVPLDLACGCGNDPPPLIAAVLADDATQLEELLQEANRQHSSARPSALLLNSHWDSARINAALQRQRSLQPGSLPQWVSMPPGCTLLMLAASLGQEAVTACLLQNGADPAVITAEASAALLVDLYTVEVLRNATGPGRCVMSPERGGVSWDPVEDLKAALKSDGVNRVPVLAAWEVPWSEERHCAFPAAFQDAVKTLLLCARRLGPSSAVQQVLGRADPLRSLILNTLAQPVHEWVGFGETSRLEDVLPLEHVRTLARLRRWSRALDGMMVNCESLQEALRQSNGGPNFSSATWAAPHLFAVASWPEARYVRSLLATATDEAQRLLASGAEAEGSGAASAAPPVFRRMNLRLTSRREPPMESEHTRAAQRLMDSCLDALRAAAASLRDEQRSIEAGQAPAVASGHHLGDLAFAKLVGDLEQLLPQQVHDRQATATADAVQTRSASGGTSGRGSPRGHPASNGQPAAEARALAPVDPCSSNASGGQQAQDRSNSHSRSSRPSAAEMSGGVLTDVRPSMHIGTAAADGAAAGLPEPAAEARSALLHHIEEWHAALQSITACTSEVRVSQCSSCTEPGPRSSPTAPGPMYGQLQQVTAQLQPVCAAAIALDELRSSIGMQQVSLDDAVARFEAVTAEMWQGLSSLELDPRLLSGFAATYQLRVPGQADAWRARWADSDQWRLRQLRNRVLSLIAAAGRSQHAPSGSKPPAPSGSNHSEQGSPISSSSSGGGGGQHCEAGSAARGRGSSPSSQPSVRSRSSSLPESNGMLAGNGTSALSNQESQDHGQAVDERSSLLRRIDLWITKLQGIMDDQSGALVQVQRQREAAWQEQQDANRRAVLALSGSRTHQLRHRCQALAKLEGELRRICAWLEPVSTALGTLRQLHSDIGRQQDDLEGAAARLEVVAAGMWEGLCGQDVDSSQSGHGEQAALHVLHSTVQSIIANTETIQSIIANTETIQSIIANTETIQSIIANTETIQSIIANTETIQSIIANTETIQSIIANTETSILSQADAAAGDKSSFGGSGAAAAASVLAVRGQSAGHSNTRQSRTARRRGRLDSENSGHKELGGSPALSSSSHSDRTVPQRSRSASAQQAQQAQRSAGRISKGGSGWRSSAVRLAPSSLATLFVFICVIASVIVRWVLLSRMG